MKKAAAPPTEGATARPTLRQVGLVVVVVILASVLADRLIVTEEEEVEAFVRAFVSAMEREDAAAFDAALAPAFHFKGPDPMGEGDHDAALERAEHWWGRASGIAIASIRNEVTLQGPTATVRWSATSRFRWGEFQVPVRSEARLDLLRVDGRWMLVEIDVSELRRGLF